MSNPILKRFDLNTKESITDFVCCSWFALSNLKKADRLTEFSRLLYLGIKFLEIEQRNDGYWLIVNDNDELGGCEIKLSEEDVCTFLKNGN